jgi:general secretion pathway protein C
MEIEKTKLFGITKSAPSTSKQAESPAPQKKLEPLNLALIGIFYNKAGGSSAIIEDTKKKVQDVFREGQSVFEIATVSSIKPGQVEVKYAGGTEVLVIEDLPSDSSPVAAPSDAKELIVQEDELNSALDNLPLLLTQARAVPYFKDGQAVGLRLFAIKSGSMFEKIGLKNGDILKNINGNNLGDRSQAMKLFEQLREERNLTLELERNRTPQTFFYKIR